MIHIYIYMFVCYWDADIFFVRIFTIFKKIGKRAELKKKRLSTSFLSSRLGKHNAATHIVSQKPHPSHLSKQWTNS